MYGHRRGDPGPGMPHLATCAPAVRTAMPCLRDPRTQAFLGAAPGDATYLFASWATNADDASYEMSGVSRTFDQALAAANLSDSAINGRQAPRLRLCATVPHASCFAMCGAERPAAAGESKSCERAMHPHMPAAGGVSWCLRRSHWQPCLRSCERRCSHGAAPTAAAACSSCWLQVRANHAPACERRGPS